MFKNFPLFAGLLVSGLSLSVPVLAQDAMNPPAPAMSHDGMAPHAMEPRPMTHGTSASGPMTHGMMAAPAKRHRTPVGHDHRDQTMMAPSTMAAPSQLK